MTMTARINFKGLSEPFKRLLIKFIAVSLGCAGCFFLQTIHVSPILAAAALGFAITFIPFPKALDAKTIQLAFCTGTFVGMSSPRIITHPRDMLAVCLIGAVLYYLSRPYFKGMGGKMGAIAFFATSIWLLMRTAL